MWLLLCGLVANAYADDDEDESTPDAGDIDAPKSTPDATAGDSADAPAPKPDPEPADAPVQSEQPAPVRGTSAQVQKALDVFNRFDELLPVQSSEPSDATDQSLLALIDECTAAADAALAETPEVSEDSSAGELADKLRAGKSRCQAQRLPTQRSIWKRRLAALPARCDAEDTHSEACELAANLASTSTTRKSPGTCEWKDGVWYVALGTSVRAGTTYATANGNPGNLVPYKGSAHQVGGGVKACGGFAAFEDPNVGARDAKDNLISKVAGTGTLLESLKIIAAPSCKCDHPIPEDAGSTPSSLLGHQPEWHESRENCTSTKVGTDGYCDVKAFFDYSRAIVEATEREMWGEVRVPWRDLLTTDLTPSGREVFTTQHLAHESGWPWTRIDGTRPTSARSYAVFTCMDSDPTARSLLGCDG